MYVWEHCDINVFTVFVGFTIGSQEQQNDATSQNNDESMGTEYNNHSNFNDSSNSDSFSNNRRHEREDRDFDYD